ncbi:MAG: hypothetical protein R3B70_43595 [Polyangiaceae bacterium]
MIRSRWFSVLGVLPLTLALAGLAGCNQPNVDDEGTDEAVSELANEPAAPAKQANPKEAKQDKARGDRHRRGGHGPGMLLGVALHELDLTDAQKATIQGELDALRGDAPARPDFQAHSKALAAAVRSGSIDEAALTAQLQPKTAPDTTRLAKAIGVLHDTLTAAQRKELIAAVEKHADRGPGMRGEHGPGMRGEHGPGMRGPLGHMLADLELTDAQREKVKEALSKDAPSEADREAMKAQHEAFRAKMKERLATFADDSFDAAAFVVMPEGAGKPGHDKMFGHMIHGLAAVVPVLDANQRARLADKIEQGPQMPRMPRGR